LEPAELTLVHDIRHGPWPLSRSVPGARPWKPAWAFIDTTIERPVEGSDKLKDVFDDFPELLASRSFITLHLGGQGEMALVIPPVRGTTVGDNPVTVDWGGLNGQMRFTADLKGFKGALNAPGLMAAKEVGRAEIKGVTSAFDMHASGDGPLLGEASLDIAHVESAETQGEERRVIAVKGLKATVSSRASGDTINGVTAMTVEEVLTDGRTYGPGGLTLELRKLDAHSLRQLQKALRDVQAGSPQASPEEVNKMVLAEFGQILPELVKHSPEFEISRLDLKTSDGDVQGRAKIVFRGDNPLALSNPLFFLSAVTAHAEFSVAGPLLERVLESMDRKELAELGKDENGRHLSDEEIDVLAVTKRQERLEGLVANHILICEDGDYKARANFERGRLTLNGRPLVLQDLLKP
jgi:uncharacterized protein YdgA (DUF945 family)